MIENETTSGGFAWRKRAIATVGVAAAVAAAGVGFASAAQAAGTTLTLTAPTSVSNNNTPATTPYSIEVNNTGAGATALTGPTATGTLTVTAPAGVNCGFINFAPTGITASSDGQTGNASPALTTPNPFQTGSCLFTGTFNQAANSDDTYNYTLTVQSAPITGNLTTSLSLAGATSNSTTTAITNPATAAATTFSSTVPPAATIYQDYSFNEIKTVATGGTFRAFGAQTAPSASDGTFSGGTDTNGNGAGLPATTTRTATETTVDPKTGKTDPAIDLSDVNGDDTFLLDTVTGNIVGHPTVTESQPYYTFTIITTGAGGATVPVAPIGAGSKVQPTPGVAVGDIDSPKFQLPVLFSDTAATSTFGSSIYGLSDQNMISGFADGTFRPAQSVTRQEFVQILFKSGGNAFPGGGIVGTGECSTIDPSAFSDVPNASPFCEAIKRLNQAGIVKGGTDGKFNPGSLITREQVAGFLYRAYSFETTQNIASDATFTSPSPFSDVTASNVFGGDIEFLANKKIVNGSNGLFRPKSATNRGETAAFIYRTQQAAL